MTPMTTKTELHGSQKALKPSVIWAYRDRIEREEQKVSHPDPCFIRKTQKLKLKFEASVMMNSPFQHPKLEG